MKTGLTAQRDDEIFDVVNDRDEVIGQATRGEVHAKRLWHRSVHAFVFNADGRIFLQKRSMLKDTSAAMPVRSRRSSAPIARFSRTVMVS